jgi:hypothetical protein
LNEKAAKCHVSDSINIIIQILNLCAQALVDMHATAEVTTATSQSTHSPTDKIDKVKRKSSRTGKHMGLDPSLILEGRPKREPIPVKKSLPDTPPPPRTQKRKLKRTCKSAKKPNDLSPSQVPRWEDKEYLRGLLVRSGLKPSSVKNAPLPSKTPGLAPVAPVAHAAAPAPAPAPVVAPDAVQDAFASFLKAFVSTSSAPVVVPAPVPPPAPAPAPVIVAAPAPAPLTSRMPDLDHAIKALINSGHTITPELLQHMLAATGGSCSCSCDYCRNLYFI